jgi:TPR repeat protein
MFSDGNGVVKDKMKALKWFLKSADQGNANAHLQWEWCCKR